MVASEPFEPQGEARAEEGEELRAADQDEPRVIDEDEPTLLGDAWFSSRFRPHLEDPE